MMMIAATRHPDDCARADVSSPVGTLTLVASARGLHAVVWKDAEVSRALAKVPHVPSHPLLARTMAELEEYFAGTRRRFDVPLAPEGTPFQLRAWRELSRIPYGETISYGEQARRLGDPKKARAVGMANARNPLAIVVPCHRVIASSGALAGFGGGLDNKRLLLRLEARAAR
jgi:methylated-DNA-[protein]-cysteine S-methyltransferase